MPIPMMPPVGAPDPNNLVPPIAPIPGEGALPAEMGMSQEEMKADIDRMLSKVNDKEQSVKTKIATDKFKFESMKGDLIRSLFDMLKKAGVNPGDPNSIKEFLSQLQQRNPDLYSIFEIAFNELMGEEETAPTVAPTQVPVGLQQSVVPPTGMPEMGGMPMGEGLGGMPDILKKRPGKKNERVGLLKKFSNLSNKTFRGK